MKHYVTIIIIIIIIQNRRLVPLISLVRPTFAGNQLNLELIDKGILSMPQIQVDQCKIHVKIISAKESRFHGSVVMTLEKH